MTPFPMSTPAMPSMPATIKPIYLLADSHLLFWTQGDAPFLGSIRALLTAQSPKVAYIGASNDDAAGHFGIFRDAMDLVGITDCRMILSIYSKEDAAFLRQADLILLAGGDVEEGWRTIDETGMRGVILERHREGAILIGIGAGAVQLGMYACSQIGASNNALIATFRLVPFLVDTRDERDDWSRLADAVGRFDGDVSGIGIPAGGGAIVHPDGVLEPVRFYIELLGMADGEVRRSIILPSDAFTDAGSECQRPMALQSAQSLAAYDLTPSLSRAEALESADPPYRKCGS